MLEAAGRAGCPWRPLAALLYTTVQLLAPASPQQGTDQQLDVLMSVSRGRSDLNPAAASPAQPSCSGQLPWHAAFSRPARLYERFIAAE